MQKKHPALRPALLLVLSTPVVAALQPKPTLARRDLLVLSTAPVLAASRAAAALDAADVPAVRSRPTDFELIPDPGRPYAHYLENAGKLADNLVWFADGVDRGVGKALDAEITSFNAIYAPRPGALVDAGPTPGLSELKTSYDALAYHFARYRAKKIAEPLPDALASTVRRNALAAQKRIQKTQAAREAARGTWP